MENEVMEFIENVREANPIERVLAAFVPEFGGLKVKGKRKLKLRCPFHEGEDAKFVVYTKEQFYHCFSCDRVGDVFDLVRELKKVDFPGALEQLAGMAGICWLKIDQDDWQNELELRALGDILGATVDFYYRSNITSGYCDHLKSSKSSLSVDIVEAKMGFAWKPEPGEVPPEELPDLVWPEGWPEALELDGVFQRARLKEISPQEPEKHEEALTARTSLAAYLASRGFNLELAKKAGVLKSDGSEFFHDTIVLPFFNRGRVVYLTGRFGQAAAMAQALPMTELARRALLDKEGLEEGKLFIVESLADALTLKKCGYSAVPVSEKALLEQRLTEVESGDRVYVWFSEPGFDRATAVGQRIVRQRGMVPYVVTPALSTHWYCQNGPRDFFLEARCEDLLTGTYDLIVTMVDNVVSCRGGDREKAVREFFRCFCWLPLSEIKGNCRLLCQALNISEGEYHKYVKDASKSEMASRDGETGQSDWAADEPSGPFLQIHPALDYEGEDGVVSVAFKAGNDDGLLPKAYLITSHREVLPLDGQQLHIGGKPVLFKSKPETPYEERWREADIERFLQGDDQSPSGRSPGWLR